MTCAGCATSGRASSSSRAFWPQRTPKPPPRSVPMRSWSPPIADAVKGRLTVLADSGVRRGTDVLKYLALGADAVLLGRLPLWGLAADGERGAEAVLRMILGEMDTAMAFLGADRVSVLRREGSVRM